VSGSVFSERGASLEGGEKNVIGARRKREEYASWSERESKPKKKTWGTKGKVGEKTTNEKAMAHCAKIKWKEKKRRSRTGPVSKPTPRQ